MNFLNYIFYKFYSYYSKGDAIPLFSSLVAFNTFLFLLIMDILLLLQLFLESEFLSMIPAFKNAPILYIIKIKLLD